MLYGKSEGWTDLTNYLMCKTNVWRLSSGSIPLVRLGCVPFPVVEMVNETPFKENENR